MNLKPFTEKPRVKRESAPTINMDYRNGRINFNRRTVEMLGLKAGDPIAFFQSGDYPGDWYFACQEKPGCYRLVCDSKKAESGRLKVISGPVVRAILRSRGLYDAQTFIIGDKEEEYWPIGRAL